MPLDSGTQADRGGGPVPGRGPAVPSDGRRPRPFLGPLLGLSLLLGALLAARLSQWAPWLIPTCGLRALTGLPCPLCGSTRSLAAWSHFQVREAFLWNPLVAAACVVLGGWLFLSAAAAALRHDWPQQLRQRAGRTPWPWIMLAAALLNWLYLFCFLPP